ncbi:MAG: hypothetical protein ACI8X5_001423, partial [Planctomycetota bacterium]
PATWNNEPEEVNGFEPESPPRSTTEQNVDLWPLTATRLEVTRYPFEAQLASSSGGVQCAHRPIFLGAYNLAPNKFVTACVSTGMKLNSSIKSKISPALFLAALTACQAAAPFGSQVREEVQDPVTPIIDSIQTIEDAEPMRIEAQLDRDGVMFVRGENPSLPLLRYEDGQVSLSNSCGVLLGNKLNRKIPPMYVNGQPFGFC